MALPPHAIYESYMRAEKCELAWKVVHYEEVSNKWCFGFGKILVKNNENTIFSINTIELVDDCVTDSFYVIYKKWFSKTLLNKDFYGVIDIKSSQILQIPTWEWELPKLEACTSEKLEVVNQDNTPTNISEKNFLLFWVILLFILTIIASYFFFKKK